MCEGGPACDEPIDIWRVNSFVAKAANRVETLVVRENQKNIWFTHALVPACCCRPDLFRQFTIRRDSVFTTRSDELMHHEILNLLFFPLV